MILRGAIGAIGFAQDESPARAIFMGIFSLLLGFMGGVAVVLIGFPLAVVWGIAWSVVRIVRKVSR